MMFVPFLSKEINVTWSAHVFKDRLISHNQQTPEIPFCITPMPGGSSQHNCWAKKKFGCNKSKRNCTEHYWNCSGARTRTHAPQRVPRNGSGCESNCRDTSDNELYTCGRSTCRPLSPPIVSLIYSTSSEYGDPLIQNSSSPSPHERRILIVGSGCFGVSTAYHLLKRGYKDVTVVDRAETLPAADAATTDLNKSARIQL